MHFHKGEALGAAISLPQHETQGSTLAMFTSVPQEGRSWGQDPGGGGVVKHIPKAASKCGPLKSGPFRVSRNPIYLAWACTAMKGDAQAKAGSRGTLILLQRGTSNP